MPFGPSFAVIRCLEDQDNVCGTVPDVGFICLLTRWRSGLARMVATSSGYRLVGCTLTSQYVPTMGRMAGGPIGPVWHETPDQANRRRVRLSKQAIMLRISLCCADLLHKSMMKDGKGQYK